MKIRSSTSSKTRRFKFTIVHSSFHSECIINIARSLGKYKTPGQSLHKFFVKFMLNFRLSCTGMVRNSTALPWFFVYFSSRHVHTVYGTMAAEQPLYQLYHWPAGMAAAPTAAQREGVCRCRMTPSVIHQLLPDGDAF